MVKPSGNGLAAKGSAKGNPLAQNNSGQGGAAGGGVNVETWDRNVKYYKLTSADVTLLGSLSLLSSILFAIGSAAVGFYFNLKVSLAFASVPLPPEALTLRDYGIPIAGWVGVIFLILGAVSTFMGIIRFGSIKKEHTNGSITI